MANTEARDSPAAALGSLLCPCWIADEENLHVTGFQPAGSDEEMTHGDLHRDAKAWALSFCRDFRALHQFNHDHDCTSTCIKYVKKGKEAAEQALKKGWVVACRFFFSILCFLHFCVKKCKK